MWTVISNEVKEDKKVQRSPRSRQHIILWVRIVLVILEFSLFCSQAAKSCSDSEDVAETDKDEDGEPGKKEQEETEKEGKEKTEPPSEEDTKKHGFLILSREDSTMVDRHVLHAATRV